MTYSLLAPGPVNLHPQVQSALSLPMIHHRTPQFDEILKKVLAQLKLVFKTEEPVYIHTSTGSGGMESLLVNTLSPGDEVLCIISGKFGERWAEMAEGFGAKIHALQVPWGESVDINQFKEKLNELPNVKAVLCQACETSTGVLHPIETLGDLISKKPNCLFLVDGITAVGAMDLPMDKWHIDGLVAGSQKAFMLPTGLSFVSFSKKAQARFLTSKMPKYYFDIRRELKANAGGETFFSSSVTLIRALGVVLDLVFEQGLDNLYSQIARRAQIARELGPMMGLEVYAKSPANSLTALKVPQGIDGQKLRAHLENKHQITIMGGQDQAKGKIIRIGHMGYILPEEERNLFEKLALSLVELNLDQRTPTSNLESSLSMAPSLSRNLVEKLDSFYPKKISK